MFSKRPRKVKKSFSLDARSFEIIQKFTKDHGVSMSTWLTGLFNEMAKQIEGQPTPWDKPVQQMTIGEFAEAIRYWGESVEEEKAGGSTLPKV